MKNKEKLTDEYLVRYLLGCRDESESAAIERMRYNQDNYDMYHLRHNFAHKNEGQSKEVLSKTRNATEQIKSFFQQSLADLDDWWKTEAEDGSAGENMLIRPEEIHKLTNHMLKKTDYFSHVGKLLQRGLLGSLSIAKVHGKLCPSPKYSVAEVKKGRSKEKVVEMSEEKYWELKIEEIRQEDYFPDPRNEDLYEIERMDVDFYRVREMAEGENAIYDKEAVESLQPWGTHDIDEQRKNRETGQNQAIPVMRPRIRLHEFWGNVVDENTGELLAENCTFTVANERVVIRTCEDNPNWHQKSPVVAGALIEVADSVWGVALMDAGTKHNRSLIEIYNLMIDSAMKAIWGITQVRVDALEDPKQLDGGIKWGMNLKTNSSLPVGGKVMESVVTGEVPSDVVNIFNLMTQETLTSMMTNDMRMGAQSQRAVKATEVVAAENSITSVFNGMAKNFESKVIQPELELAWKTIAQNWDLIDPEMFKSLFGEERGTELSQLDPQDVFVNTVNGSKFSVFGISVALKKQADYRKWTQLLQTIGTSEVLIEAFLAKYSFEKFLGEIMSALDIDKTKIENDQMKQAQGNPLAAGAQMPPVPGPNMGSQLPQPAASPGPQSGGFENVLAEAFSGMQAGNS